MPVVAIPKNLNEKLGDDASKDLVEAFTTVYDVQKKDIIEIVEQKFEAKLTKEISRLELKFTHEMSIVNEKIANVKTELKTDIANVKTEIAKTKAELIKWMFVFWVGSLASISGIMYLLMKAMLDK